MIQGREMSSGKHAQLKSQLKCQPHRQDSSQEPNLEQYWAEPVTSGCKSWPDHPNPAVMQDGLCGGGYTAQ